MKAGMYGVNYFTQEYGLTRQAVVRIYRKLFPKRYCRRLIGSTTIYITAQQARKMKKHIETTEIKRTLNN